MANDSIRQQDVFPRLNSISEELRAINTQIIASLETLPEQTELVDQLVRRCDDISLELDAIQMEVGGSTNGSSAGGKKNLEQPADRPGLNP